MTVQNENCAEMKGTETDICHIALNNFSENISKNVNICCFV